MGRITEVIFKKHKIDVLHMTRKTLALVLPALLLVVALMAGTTMAMQV